MPSKVIIFLYTYSDILVFPKLETHSRVSLETICDFEATGREHIKEASYCLCANLQLGGCREKIYLPIFLYALYKISDIQKFLLLKTVPLSLRDNSRGWAHALLCTTWWLELYQEQSWAQRWKWTKTKQKQTILVTTKTPTCFFRLSLSCWCVMLFWVIFRKFVKKTPDHTQLWP